MQSLTTIVGEDGKTLFDDVYAQLALSMPNAQATDIGRPNCPTSHGKTNGKMGQLDRPN
jgi:hypothetical protein